jgi:hypothetical protein
MRYGYGLHSEDTPDIPQLHKLVLACSAARLPWANETRRPRLGEALSMKIGDPGFALVVAASGTEVIPPKQATDHDGDVVVDQGDTEPSTEPDDLHPSGD